MRIEKLFNILEFKCENHDGYKHFSLETENNLFIVSDYLSGAYELHIYYKVHHNNIKVSRKICTYEGIKEWLENKFKAEIRQYKISLI